MNMHTPERLQGESFNDYKARRQQSHAFARGNSHPVNTLPFAQHNNPAANARRAAKRAEKNARVSAAQSPKPVTVRYHKPKASTPPTWPATADQHAQSRPVIVVKPNRAARIAADRKNAEILQAA